MSESIILYIQEGQDLSYTYIDASLQAEFPGGVELVSPISPLILRSPQDKAQVLKHPLFMTD